MTGSGEAIFLNIVLAAIFFSVLYLTIRNGVRDGIRQAHEVPASKGPTQT